MILSRKKEEQLIHAFSDFPFFASEFLKIQGKSGKVHPFTFLRGQHYLHQRIEQQLAETGRVRVVLLKGRQGGYSTYVQGRYFWKVTTTRGKKAFILTHEAEATKNLFGMAKKFYEKMEPGIIPVASTLSAKEMKFDRLDSGYAVATARNEGAGRGQTVQLFHGSEVAFWTNADLHQKGIMQAVPNERGSEIILESTANGLGGYFYEMWQSALEDDSEYEAIFIPWYWQDDYTADLRPNESPDLTDEEIELFVLHKDNGLTKRHLYWRRRKLKEMSNDHETALSAFRQEYPFNAVEAFRNPVDDVYIKSHLVERARRNHVEEDSSIPLLIGVDPAISDKDSLGIIRRRGRKAYGLELKKGLEPMQIVGLIGKIIEHENPTTVYIDSIGIGAGIYDRLKECGYTCVKAVNVGLPARDRKRFANTRAEIYNELREWLAQDADVEIPDNDILAGNLTCFGYKYRSNGQELLESKEEMRERGLKSPDAGDALALTFADGQYIRSGSTNYYNEIPQHLRGRFR